MDIVAKVGITLCRTALGSKECPCFEKGSFSCADEHPGRMARAALAAMLEAVGEPVAYLQVSPSGSVRQLSYKPDNLDADELATGWTETPLYSLAALNQE